MDGPITTTARTTPTAALVVIGDEILSGKTADTNTPFAVAELRALGVAVRRITVVPDEVDAIVDELRRARERHDYVFTSGGVGPTHDDVTIQAVARALARPVVRSEEIVRAMHALWQPVKETHLRMADVPEGAELLYGRGLRFPVIRVENIYVLPGVPEIFREKLVSLRETLRSAPFHLTRVFSSYGEGRLAPLMEQVVAAHRGVSVGSYPTLTAPDHRVLVTFESKEEAAVAAAVEAFVALVGAAGVVRVERAAADVVQQP